MNKKLLLLTIVFLTLWSSGLNAQGSCATAVTLTPGIQQCGDTSSGGDVFDDNSCLGNYDGGDDYLFVITVLGANDGNALQLDLTSPGSWTGIAISEGCPEGGGGTCFGSSTSSSGNESFTSDPLTGGNTYYIHISTWPSPQTAAFCLDAAFVIPPMPPINDNCGGVIDLGLLISPISGNTCLAAKDFGDDCLTDAGAPDVVYSIEVPSGCTLTIGQTSNDYDSKHRLAYGPTCPGSNLIVCTDDPDTQTETWTNTTGSNQTAYWVQSAYQTNCGDYELEWEVICCTPPTIENISISFANCPTTNEISFDVTDMGTASTIVVTNDAGGTNPTPITSTGSYSITNIVPVGTISITFTPDNVDCTVNLGPYLLGCPPAEDVCGGAINIPVDMGSCTSPITTGNNLYASDSDNDIPAPPSASCSSYAGGDIWFKLTIPASGTVIISGAASDCCSFLWYEIYDGSDCASLSFVGCSGTTGNNPSNFENTLSGRTPGETIWIRAWDSSNDNGPGDFNFCAYEPPPPPSNNECISAMDITIGSPISQNTDQATNVENMTPCSNNNTCELAAAVCDFTNGVWYKYTSTQAETITVSTDGSDFDTEIQVFEGSCGNFTCIGGDDDSGTSTQSMFCWSSTASFQNSGGGSSSARMAPVDYYIYIDGHGTASGNAVTSLSTVLPIEISSFNARENKDHNIIEWSTASEINNEWQIVERSSDGQNRWTEVDRVRGNELSEVEVSYSVLDRSPMNDSYYRLKSIDYDGYTQFSDIRYVARKSNLSNSLKISPNPNNGIFSLSDELINLNDDVTVSVKDLSGRIVYTSIINFNHSEINISHLSSGLYMIEISSGTEVKAAKIAKY